MSRNPYFAHLPTRSNRQDLVFALDSLPRLLTSFSSSSDNNSSDCCPSPPGSPCSPYATFTHGSHNPSSPWSTLSSTSSATSSTSSSSPISTFYQHQYQQRLIQRHIRRSYSHSTKSTLQFSTRAQAMGFLINLLQSFQQEPCECDLVQGCFCSPEGVEDHSGLAPCYVCGEWYAEQVFCTNEEDEYTKVDGRSWHERGGASLRHQVAETRVRQWLDHVVVPIASAATWSSSQSPYYHQQQHYPQHPHEQEQEQEQHQSTIIRSRPGRSASCPAPAPASIIDSTNTTTVSIPEEILDPTTRSPGFRIKRRVTIATERPSRLPSLREEGSSTCSSFSAPSSASSTLTNSSRTAPFRFSFTSERFNAAIQESLSRRSSTTTTTSVDTAHEAANNNNASTKTTTSTKERQAEAVTVAVQEQEQEQEQAEAESGMASVETKTETETASPSAWSTTATIVSPSLSSSSPSSSRSSSTTGTVIGDNSFHCHRDQCGVVDASTVAQQHFSSASAFPLSSSVSTGTSPMVLPSTASIIGKTELESQAHAIHPIRPQEQQQQHEGRGRARRRGQGHVRQPAQSHIQVMGSFLKELQQQKEKEQADISSSSYPNTLPSSSSPLTSQVATRSTISNSIKQQGLLTPMAPPQSSTPSSTLPSSSARAKRTVSFSLPLPTIVISPPPQPTATETEGEAVGEWRSYCDTQSPNITLPLSTNTINNGSTYTETTTSSTTTTRSLGVDLGLGLLQTIYRATLALGWWSCSSLGGSLLFFSALPSAVSAMASASTSTPASTCT